MKKNNPDKIKTEKDTSGFNTASSISTCVYNNKRLRELWQSLNLSFPDMLRLNNNKLLKDKKKYAPILTPGTGFRINAATARMTKNKIIIDLQLPDPEIKNQLERGKHCTAAGIIINQDLRGNRSNTSSVYFNNFIIPEKEFLRMTIPISANNRKEFYQFHLTKIYLVLIPLDENGKPLNYSQVIKNESL